ATPRADAKVVHLGVDPLFERYPHRAFTAQLAITGSSRAGLERLDEALQARPAKQAALERRRAAVAAFNAEKAAALAALNDKARGEKPIRYSYVGKCVHDALPKNGIVITELGVGADHFALEEPG